MEYQKRKISILLPLKKQGESLEIFFQKRSADAPTLPGYFGFWGGGAEGDETAEQALGREMREELGFDVAGKNIQFFNHYEFLRSVKDVYLFWPDGSWEGSLVIGEGDYGRWFSLEEALKSDKIILEDKVVLNDLERELLQRPIC
jgi:8-oxo-dGTP pyrophosphatase MutT (NUDIX family)